MKIKIVIDIQVMLKVLFENEILNYKISWIGADQQLYYTSESIWSVTT